MRAPVKSAHSLNESFHFLFPSHRMDITPWRFHKVVNSREPWRSIPIRLKMNIYLLLINLLSPSTFSSHPIEWISRHGVFTRRSILASRGSALSQSAHVEPDLRRRATSGSLRSASLPWQQLHHLRLRQETPQLRRLHLMDTGLVFLGIASNCAIGCVRPSVCLSIGPSVRPSVHPSFVTSPGEILIYCKRATTEMWVHPSVTEIFICGITSRMNHLIEHFNVGPNGIGLVGPFVFLAAFCLDEISFRRDYNSCRIGVVVVVVDVVVVVVTAAWPKPVAM